MKKDKRSRIIIGALLITVILMTVGYAVLATKLTLGNNKKANWNISYESISKNTSLSSKDAVEIDSPVASGTAVTFNVKLPKPGSKIVYDLVVQNTGTIDATFNKVAGVDSLNQVNPSTIKFKVDRLDEPNGSIATGSSDLLNTDGKNYFRVTIEWPASNNQATTEQVKAGTISLEYIQKAD